MTIEASEQLPDHPGYPSGLVVGMFAVSKGDGADPGEHPDILAATSLRISFRPLVPQVYVSSPAPSMMVLPDPINAVIGGDGLLRLAPAGEAAAENPPGIWLPVGTYHVQYTGRPNASRPKDHDITVTTDHTEAAPLDLAEVANVWIPPPNVTVQTVKLPQWSTDGQVLTVQDDALAWVAPSGGGGGGGAVDSVNGQTGAVVLDAADVGADPAGTASSAVGALVGTLADVATSGAYSDLSGSPTIPAAPGDVGAATAAQGVLADTAVQPGDDANTLGSGAANNGKVLTADGAGGAAWETPSGGGGGGAVSQTTPAVGTYFLSPWLTGGALDKPASSLNGYAFVPVPSPMTIDSVSIYVHTGQTGAVGSIEVYAATPTLGVGALVTTLNGADFSSSGRKDLSWSHAVSGPGLFFLVKSTVGSVRLISGAPVGPGAGIGNDSPSQTMPAAVNQYPGAITTTPIPRTEPHVPMVMLRRSA